jgi:hypothetical protein
MEGNRLEYNLHFHYGQPLRKLHFPIGRPHVSMVMSSVADPDPGSGFRDPVPFYPKDPISGSGMIFFRIPDLGSRI